MSGTNCILQRRSTCVTVQFKKCRYGNQRLAVTRLDSSEWYHMLLHIFNWGADVLSTGTMTDHFMTRAIKPKKHQTNPTPPPPKHNTPPQKPHTYIYVLQVTYCLTLLISTGKVYHFHPSSTNIITFLEIINILTQKKLGIMLRTKTRYFYVGDITYLS